VRADYGERYAELYRHHWWWRARERVILDTIRSQQPPQGWKRILDVGCGDGLLFDQLLQFGEVEGVEPAEAIVSKTGNHRARIHIAPFDDKLRLENRFSLILMLDVLEHLANPLPPLQYALELLVSGGTLLVTVPAFRLLWTGHDILNDHFRRYTKSSFRQLASQAGLQIESERYLFQWLFPVKVATRLAEQAFGIWPKPPAVPARWVNELLYGLSRFEQDTWGALPMPFGSSLMVIGRKRSSADISETCSR
jgi:SAM-dependent methyltransferase